MPAFLASAIGWVAFVRPDTALSLAWLALVAVPVGWGLGAARTPPAVALLAPLAWLACGAFFLSPPTLALAGAAWTGLAACGYAGGVLAPRGTFVAALVCAGACWLPGLGWSPPVAARLLDLSPATLVIESAGIDWMRHPAVYEPVGADAIGPELRLPWRGKLAGPVVLLVGCTLTLVARRTARIVPCPPASSSARSPKT
ncbi:MAG: hypothetical protein GY711_28260 [bacterium]|nr:hypothetical protein [bacterium]